MVKAFFVLHRKPGMDSQAFRDYWLNVHGPIAAKIPGMRRYVQSHALPDANGQPTVIDGLAELHFDSAEALQAGLASAEGQATLADIPNFLDGSRIGMIVVEDHQII